MKKEDRTMKPSMVPNNEHKDIPGNPGRILNNEY